MTQQVTEAEVVEIAGRPVRVQLRRTKGWRMPPNTVKIDRSTRWGNPFNLKAAHHCWTALAFGEKADPAGRHAASVTMFRLWLEGGRAATVQHCGLYGNGPDGRVIAAAESPAIEAPTPPTIADIRRELGGKDLACWCAPTSPCHADVLLELANPASNKEASNG